MYAVIKSGGKQHKVSEGEEILLEKISLDEGDVIEFSEVLAVNKDGNLNVGKPLLEGAVVKAKVLNHLKTKKLRSLKWKEEKITEKNKDIGRI